MDNENKLMIVDAEMDALLANAIQLIQYARKLAVKQVNTVQLMTFYSLGRWIVEVQQKGESRAKYGEQVIQELSRALTEQFGKGFSEGTLKNARKFYLNYKDRISETVFTLFAVEKSETVFAFLEKETPFPLPWSHYLLLMRIKEKTKTL